MLRRRTRGSFAVMLALSALLALGLAACGDDDDDAADTETESGQDAEGADSIQIEYLDYAYAVSGPLTSGGTIEFKNSGKEMHMAALGRLKAGKTLEDVKTLLEEEEGGEEGGEDSPTVEETTTTADGDEGGGEEGEDPFAELMDEVGQPGNLMGPGQSIAVTIPDLEPGTYATMCFLQKEGSGEPHFALGMINEFEVVEGDVEEPTADTTYQVAPGEAPDGPATLTAGEHTIKFEATNASELEPAFGRLDPGKTYQDLQNAIDAVFESEDGPPAGAAESLPGDIVWSGFDFEGDSVIYVTVTFEPGKYILLANDTDVEDAPEPPKELLEITVS